MPSYTDLPIEDRLTLANQAISNTESDAELAALLAPAGYGPDQLAEGRVLLTTAAAAHGRTFTEEGETEAASNALETLWKAARKDLRRHVALARPALDERPGLARELRVDEARERRQAAWLVQTRQFYARALANDEARALLNGVGLEDDELQAALDRVDAIETALQKRNAEDAEDQDATDARDKAMVPLDKWVRRFRDVARPTLEDRPQLLEKLGFLARS